MSTKYGGEEELVREINRLTKELDYVKQLRRGDDILIRNLAGAVDTKITAPNNMLGLQWEQFRVGRPARFRSAVYVRLLALAADLLRTQRNHRFDVTSSAGRHPASEISEKLHSSRARAFSH
jgi:hypothetical protein